MAEVKRINVGVIGTGWVGGIRANACAHNGIVDELHIAEINPKRQSEIQAETNPTSITDNWQAIIDNDVRGLNSKLAQLATNMQQILEQQKVLLDLRSQVDKSTTITDTIGDKLDVIQTEIDDIWKAYDSIVENPL